MGCKCSESYLIAVRVIHDCSVALLDTVDMSTNAGESLRCADVRI